MPYYTTAHRLATDLLAARYLDAMESDDAAADVTIEAIWRIAETRPDLVTALEELHEGLLEEAAAAGDAGA